MSCMVFLPNESKESKARKILEHAKILIIQASGSSADDWFYINRFVYARLQLEERAKNLKRKLFSISKMVSVISVKNKLRI